MSFNEHLTAERQIHEDLAKVRCSYAARMNSSGCKTGTAPAWGLPSCVKAELLEHRRPGERVRVLTLPAFG